MLTHHEVLRLCAVLASSSHVSTKASQGRVEGDKWTSKEEARREGQGGRGRSSSSMMNFTDPVNERHTRIRLLIKING